MLLQSTCPITLPSSFPSNVEALLAARGERVKRKEDSSLDTIELSPEDILGNSQLHNIVKGDSS